MAHIPELWLPILLSAAIVFIASSIIHLLLRYHASDFKPFPDEDGVMDALRPFDIELSDYVLPHAGSMAAMKEQAFVQKSERGPVGFITITPPGNPSMGRGLLLWFLYCILVGVFSAYMAGRALERGTHYLAVFRFAGCVTFASYELALFQNSIWL